MSLSATSALFWNTSRDGDSTTFLDSPCRCLSAPSEKLFFLISTLNLSWCNLRSSLLILLLLPRSRSWPLLCHNLLTGSCREQWDLLWASFSPDWTISAPSAAPHNTCAPDLCCHISTFVRSWMAFHCWSYLMTFSRTCIIPHRS